MVLGARFLIQMDSLIWRTSLSHSLSRILASCQLMTWLSCTAWSAIADLDWSSSDHAYFRWPSEQKVGSNTIILMKYVARERTKLSTQVSFCFGFGKWTLNLCLQSNLMNFFKNDLSMSQYDMVKMKCGPHNVLDEELSLGHWIGQI